MSMKRLPYLIIVLLFLFACDGSNQFVIKGVIENGKDKKVTLSELLVNGTKDIQTIEINSDGSFKFKAKTDIPKFYQLSISKNNFITLLVEPGEKISIKASSNNLSIAKIEGSNGSLLVQDINNQLVETKHKLDSIVNKINAIKDTDNNSNEFDELNSQYGKIVDTQRDSSIAFIIRNLNSLASIVALYQKYDNENYILYKNRDLQYIKIVSEALTKKYPDSQHVKALLANKDDLLKRYNQAVSNKKINKILNEQSNVLSFPEIYLPNTSGDSISLNQIKSKYILINFWASWSEESIKRNLKLKSIYNKYHSKGFEIYEISLDTKIENWTKSIKFDQLPWINVIDVSGRMSYYAKIFNVKSLPTSYLVNPEGEIVFANPSMKQLNSTFEYNLK